MGMRGAEVMTEWFRTRMNYMYESREMNMSLLGSGCLKYASCFQILNRA
ncbi:MAG: hypothetical protein SOX32_02315 [Candidatus Choladocola sp.]|nr:hypothetical protein [Candidatus Choladocola sp.]